MHFPIHKPNGKRSVKHHHLRHLCNVKLQDHAVKGHTKRRPSPLHPAQALSSGMLWRNRPWNVGKVTICLSLRKGPLLSLANYMWNGEIPWVVKINCKEGAIVQRDMG